MLNILLYFDFRTFISSSNALTPQHIVAIPSRFDFKVATICLEFRTLSDSDGPYESKEASGACVSDMSEGKRRQAFSCSIHVAIVAARIHISFSPEVSEE